VADAALGHDGNVHGGHDLTDFFRGGHAGYSAFGADLGGHALEGHDGYGAGLFGDGGLLGVGDVHDDAALEHFGEAGFEAKAGRVSIVLRHSGLFSVAALGDGLWALLNFTTLGAGGRGRSAAFGWCRLRDFNRKAR